MPATKDWPTPTSVLRAVQEGMGKAGVLNYGEVAKRADLHVRTVRGVDETTTVETLRKIATGLGFELVIRIEPRETTP